MLEVKYVGKTIPLRNIIPSPLLFVREITEEDIDDLAGSMDDVGQIHRIIVRPIGRAGRMYELLAGMRRYRALKKAGAKDARCDVTRCDDEMARKISLVENLKIKKPKSKEWADAAKELAELVQSRLEREARQAEDRGRTKKKPTKKTEESDLLGPGPKKHKGRPPSLKRAARRQVAESTGVSESTINRAINRADKLVSAAKSAWKTGRITDRQADRLANMNAKDQARQLSKMIKETQEETRQRVNQERESQEKGTRATSYTIKALKGLVEQAEQISKGTQEFMRYVDGRDIDWDRVLAEVKVNLDPCIEDINSLREFLTD